MGSCLGHCRWAEKVYNFRNWKYERKFDNYEANSSNDDLYDRFGQNIETDFKSRFKKITSVFSKLKPKKDSSLRLELLDDAWCSSDNEFSYPSTQTASLPWKCRTHRSVHSTAANSVELEWEHLPEMVQHKLSKCCESVVAEDVGSGTSASAWSRGSSRDSLEWDPRGDTMNIDEDETEKLLQEIERLSARALEETTGWAS